MVAQKRMLSALLLSATLATLPGAAQAVVVSADSTANPDGITHNDRPALGGVSEYDELFPIYCSSSYLGYLQVSITRSSLTNQLDFYYRFIVDSSSAYRPHRITAYGFDGAERNDMDWRPDGLGDADPDTVAVWTNSTPDRLEFRWDDPAEAGHSSRFVFDSTEAEDADFDGFILVDARDALWNDVSCTTVYNSPRPAY